MSVSPVLRSQFSSDFDETWHTHSLIFNLDFVESFLIGGNKGEKGKFALAILTDFYNF